MSLALLLPLKASIWSVWTSQIGILLSCEKITYTFRIVTLLLPNSITFPTDIFLNLKSDFSWDVQNCTITAQIKPEALFFFSKKILSDFSIFSFPYYPFFLPCSAGHLNIPHTAGSEFFLSSKSKKLDFPTDMFSCTDANRNFIEVISPC